MKIHTGKFAARYWDWCEMIDRRHNKKLKGRSIGRYLKRLFNRQERHASKNRT